MTVNPIVEMANKIRDAIGTTQHFTLAEISELSGVNKNYPACYPIFSMDINGSTPSGSGLIDINGGDVITYTFNYQITTPNLLRKLVGSKANLSFGVPVAKYMNNFTATAVNQTIMFLKNDGTALFSPVNINDGDTNYSFSGYVRKEALTSEIAEYLITNQPIKVKYSNVGSHDGTQISSTATFTLNTY